MRSVSAMFILLTLAALAVLAVGATVRALTNDGYHAVPTDPRRLP